MSKGKKSSIGGLLKKIFKENQERKSLRIFIVLSCVKQNLFILNIIEFLRIFFDCGAYMEEFYCILRWASLGKIAHNTQWYGTCFQHETCSWHKEHPPRDSSQSTTKSLAHNTQTVFCLVYPRRSSLCFSQKPLSQDKIVTAGVYSEKDVWGNLLNIRKIFENDSHLRSTIKFPFALQYVLQGIIIVLHQRQ